MGQNTGKIENCSNSGTISPEDSDACVGGIIGTVDIGALYKDGTIKNCYNLGNISVTKNSYAGGIVGGEQESGHILNSYFDQDACIIRVGDALVAVENKKAVGSSDDTSFGKLTTANMTGAGALSKMGFDEEFWLALDGGSDSGVVSNKKEAKLSGLASLLVWKITNIWDPFYRARDYSGRPFRFWA